MSKPKFVTYLRVSTDQQGRSGLGLEAQRESVRAYLGGIPSTSVGEFMEVESGRKANRPELMKAISMCRIYGAVLLVAKLDRLSRNAHFLLGLKEANVDFVCCDSPNANRLTVGIMAMVAEEEARLISVRTKAALEAAKRRGVKLGRPNLSREASALGAAASATSRSERSRQRALDIKPVIDEIVERGFSTSAEITRELNVRNIPAAQGGAWTITQLQRLLTLIP